jgi:hypothetical protein
MSKKKAKTLGTPESPHHFSKDYYGYSVQELLPDFLEKNPEGLYELFVVYCSTDKGKHWDDLEVFPSQQAAERFAAKEEKGDRRRSIEIQENKWDRQNGIDGQTRQIVQFTLNKKTSKKKIAEYAAQMQEHVDRLRGKKTPKDRPKFVPIESEVGMYKIEKVGVEMRKELVIN